MSNQNGNEPMLDLFIFESMQLLEQMELLIIANEKSSAYANEAINEIFPDYAYDQRLRCNDAL